MSTLNDFTEPQIVNYNDLNKLVYIEFYFNGKRKRIANGDTLNQRIKPNRCRTVGERTALLGKLHFELKKAIENNNYPVNKAIDDLPSTLSSKNLHFKIETDSLGRLLFKAVRAKLKDNLASKYKRNLKSVYRAFRRFLTQSELEAPLSAIKIARIESFLLQFGSSGTYYMNKRRDLGVLFTAAGRSIDLTINSVGKTNKKKVKATLHKPYQKEQLKPILNYLKHNHSNLYLCCLLTYGTWLRPHEEVRLLTPNDFKKDNNEIHLSGDENKGGKVRVVYVPEYVKVEIISILNKLSNMDNIFSKSNEPYNVYYFNTGWSRAFKKMFALGLIYENQTIYSFRHTAAIELYRKTKDVYLLQKLLGHSSILVTLKYLRSLGELNSEDLKNAAPTLDFDDD